MFSTLLLQVPPNTLPAWLSGVLSVVGLVALLWNIYTFIRKESADAKGKREVAEKAAAQAEADWKAGRIRELAAMQESLKAAESTRLQDKMKMEGDLAAITNILQRTVQAADQFATVAESSRWQNRELARHDEQFKAVHIELTAIQQDIKSILIRASDEKPRHA